MMTMNRRTATSGSGSNPPSCVRPSPAPRFSRAALAIHSLWMLFLALSAPKARALGSDRALPLQRVVLATNLHEPMQHAIAPDGSVYLAERRGAIKRWDPSEGTCRLIAQLHVFTGPEDGILGMALDPAFPAQPWIYLYHSTPGILENRATRWRLKQGEFDTNSAQVLLRVPTRIPKPNHSGGGLCFDDRGNLLIGTGDYTVAGQSDGFAPLDWRPGHELNDSCRTAANTDDLRGKILRIHPEADGSVSIPSGNLFPPGTPHTRPEIYIMGCRNPFRLHFDTVGGALYWGDVGPDATGPSPERGPAGFDEFNVARHAGNYGWPLFSADNRPYRRFDFETHQSGDAFDPMHPVNASPNSTGLRELPPATGAFLWYPPGLSTRWPEVGSGARSAMAGPTYHWNSSMPSRRALPRALDGVTFLHDWERRWILAARIDATANKVTGLERLLPQMDFKRPIDLELGPDGALYVLEWGSNWSDNADAALTRIESAVE